jgi:uncharacterized protein YpuA (DUF1002 family)
MNIKKIFVFVLAILMAVTTFITPAYANSEQYLILGENLSDSEKATILELLGVDDVEHYNVAYITNAEEYEHLGDYLSSDIIGSRALSSALLTKEKEGHGISIETFNITYCTKEMYQNALITAGVKDISVKIAGPFKISGTAALVATIKSYEIMTGKTLDPDAIDAANNEIVVTQDLGNDIGAEKAAELIAALKQEIAKMGDNYTKEDILKILEDLCAKLEITLTEENKQDILALMDKLSKIDIDEEALKEQAKEIYGKVKDYVIKLEEQGVFEKIWDAIVTFFKSIFEIFKSVE